MRHQPPTCPSLDQAVLDFQQALESDSPRTPTEYCAEFAARGGDASTLRTRLEALLFVEQGLRHDRAQSATCTQAPVAGTPDRIGAYRILRTLGQGGMGTVFLAEQDEPVHRLVALKLIRLGMDTERVLRRFELERETLGQMHHSAIAQVLDAGTNDRGQPYFVMEYVEGQQITSYCEAHRVGLKCRLKLFQRVCAGVQHAHEQGVVHRDLKPSNILVTEEDGELLPKVIDFGLAKVIRDPDLETSTPTLTLEGQVVGTPEYMAPEQAAEANAAIDERSDVYALGVILYQLLCGELPIGGDGDFRAAGPNAMRQRIREEDPVAPSHRRQAQVSGSSSGTRSDPQAYRIHSDLDRICLKALEKEPGRRYPSPAEFAQDLQRFLDHRPVHARPQSAAYRTSRFVRKHRILVAATLLILLSMGAGLVVAIAYYVRARHHAATAEAALQRSDELVDTMRRSNGLAPAKAPSGDFVLGTWKTDFEAAAARIPEGQDSAPFELLDRDSADGSPRTSWFLASDYRGHQVHRQVRGIAGGSPCLWMQGSQKTEPAAMSRLVDPLHGSHATEFTLSFLLRWDDDRGASDTMFQVSLAPRSVWHGLYRPDRSRVANGRHLLQIGTPPGKATAVARQVGITVDPSQDPSQWRPVSPGSFHAISIRYRRIAGNRVEIHATLDGEVIPTPPPGPAWEHEGDLTWLHLSAGREGVWIDEIEVRRTLPSEPWHQSPIDHRFYALTPRPMDFAEARRFAASRGGRLARLLGLQHRDWIRGAFGRNPLLLGLARSDADDPRSAWQWLDAPEEPISIPWANPSDRTDPARPVASLAGYSREVLGDPQGDGRLVAVRGGAQLPALLVFDEEPTRERWGPLAGDLERATSLGGRGVDNILPFAAVAACRAGGEPDGYVICGTMQGDGVVGKTSDRQGATEVLLRSAGAQDVVVLRFDRYDRLRWARILGGPGVDRGRAVAVGPDQRIYVAGSFTGTATLRTAGSEPAVLHRVRGQGRDLFLACLSPGGELEWLRPGGGPGEDWATDLAIGSTGAIYLVGNVSAGARLGSMDSLPHAGGEDMLLACFDSRGQLDWALTSGGPEADRCEAVTALPDGGVVIGGGFGGVARFGDCAGTAPAERRSGARARGQDPAGRAFNMFLACYDAKGRRRWLNHYDGTGGRSMLHSLAADDSGIYLTGALDQSLFFDQPNRSHADCMREREDLHSRLARSPGDDTLRQRLRRFRTVSSVGWVDILVAKVDPSGGHVWADTLSGQEGRNIAYDLAAAPDGSILLTGQIEGACLFGRNQPYRTLRSSYSVTHPDVFVAALRSDTGTLRWVRSARGPGTNWGSGIAVLSPASAIVVGGLNGPTTFGEGESHQRVLDRGGAFAARFRLRASDR